MQKLTPQVIGQLNELPGFPPAPTGPGNAPANPYQFILGDYLEEIRVRPGVALVADLPATGNTTGDVRIVVSAQAWYFWTGVAWIPMAGGGPPSSANPSITGQVTAGLVSGEVCYLSAAETWSPAQAGGTLSQATSLGLYDGTPGTIFLSASSTVDLRCTTAGGLPATNAKLYLAPASEDGGTGAGKATATPPTPPPGGSVHLQVIGVCVNNASYGASKVVKAIFQPAYPVILLG